MADPLSLDRQVCFALAIASRNVIGLYRPLLEPMGLTHPQYLVMLALWERAPLSVKELSELLRLDPGTLSPLLKRLEAVGYIRRRRDSQDQRVLAVSLTPEGSGLRGEAEKVPPAIVKRLGMTVEELQELHRSLTRLIAAADGAASPTHEESQDRERKGSWPEVTGEAPSRGSR
ncbi:MarR family winged helix-turn-helix transcriptional regulator [Streptosporangium sp. NPDC000563]|uniref:MarR family winged helix-turn-helix transcriptional regulator n=1 Tax=unclassified Streptosporangium TaxID=2632669 RepID=UPI00332ED883